MPVRHKIKSGDDIAAIAVKHGFLDWQSLWLHDDNSALRDKRANAHVLDAGDVVIVPDVETKAEQCDSEQVHTFTCKLPTRTEPVRLKLHNRDGTPMANKPYTATLPGGATPLTGQSDGDGVVLLEVPVAVKHVQLEIADHEWALDIGHLRPVDEECRDDGVSGAQSRLRNLGYLCPASGSVDERTRASLQAFQSRWGVGQSGVLDGPTKTKLRERHGC